MIESPIDSIEQFNNRLSKLEDQLNVLESKLPKNYDYLANCRQQSNGVIPKFSHFTSTTIDQDCQLSISKIGTETQISNSMPKMESEKKFEPLVPKSNLKTIANGEDCPIDIHSSMDKIESLKKLFEAIGFQSFEFVKVASNYYDLSLSERKLLLSAESENQLCKSIIMENVRWSNIETFNESQNPKYICVIVQYIRKLNSDKLNRACQSLSNKKLSKNKINFRLCSESDNSKLSGYNHNAVTPFGMKFNMPIVLSHSILLDNLEFFLGGGEVDLKIKLNSTEFIDKMNCLVADIAN